MIGVHTVKFYSDYTELYQPFGIRINKLLQDIPTIELSDIADDQEPYSPVWTINQPVIRLDLGVGIQRETHPTNFMSLFDNFY